MMDKRQNPLGAWQICAGYGDICIQVTDAESSEITVNRDLIIFVTFERQNVLFRKKFSLKHRKSS